MENKKEENETRAQKMLQKLVIEKLSWRINNSSGNAGDTDWTSERAKKRRENHYQASLNAKRERGKEENPDTLYPGASR